MRKLFLLLLILYVAFMVNAARLLDAGKMIKPGSIDEALLSTSVNDKLQALEIYVGQTQPELVGPAKTFYFKKDFTVNLVNREAQVSLNHNINDNFGFRNLFLNYYMDLTPFDVIDDFEYGTDGAEVAYEGSAPVTKDKIVGADSDTATRPHYFLNNDNMVLTLVDAEKFAMVLSSVYDNDLDTIEIRFNYNVATLDDSEARELHVFLKNSDSVTDDATDSFDETIFTFTGQTDGTITMSCNGHDETIQPNTTIDLYIIFNLVTKTKVVQLNGLNVYSGTLTNSPAGNSESFKQIYFQTATNGSAVNTQYLDNIKIRHHVDYARLAKLYMYSDFYGRSKEIMLFSLNNVKSLVPFYSDSVEAVDVNTMTLNCVYGTIENAVVNNLQVTTETVTDTLNANNIVAPTADISNGTFDTIQANSMTMISMQLDNLQINKFLIGDFKAHGAIKFYAPVKFGDNIRLNFNTDSKKFTDDFEDGIDGTALTSSEYFKDDGVYDVWQYKTTSPQYISTASEGLLGLTISDITSNAIIKESAPITGVMKFKFDAKLTSGQTTVMHTIFFDPYPEDDGTIADYQQQIETYISTDTGNGVIHINSNIIDSPVDITDGNWHTFIYTMDLDNHIFSLSVDGTDALTTTAFYTTVNKISAMKIMGDGQGTVIDDVTFTEVIPYSGKLTYLTNNGEKALLSVIDDNNFTSDFTFKPFSLVLPSTAITSPEKGNIVFDTSLKVWNGSEWEQCGGYFKNIVVNGSDTITNDIVGDTLEINEGVGINVAKSNTKEITVSLDLSYSNVVKFEAGDTVSVGDVVSINDSGLLVKALGISTEVYEAIGIALTNGISGEIVSVKISGIVQNSSWTLPGTIGKALYLDSVNAGGLTDTPSTNSGDVVKRIGIKLSDTKILVELGDSHINP